jgi:hypothetical protein
MILPKILKPERFALLSMIEARDKRKEGRGKRKEERGKVVQVDVKFQAFIFTLPESPVV